MVPVKEISSIASKAGIKDVQVEKDHVISWILFGIAHIPSLKESMIFKGGTLLKKAYFPNYRFPDELEFRSKGDFDLDAFKTAFSELIKFVSERSGITLALRGDVRSDAGHYNFGISYKGALAGSGSGKEIRVEIGKNELVYHAPEEKEMNIPYTDLVNEKFSLLCYTLDEVAAEKMCSLMQRTAPRDLYDLWYLLEMSGNAIEDCIFAFEEKARFKNLDPKDLVRVIEEKEATFAKYWKEHLASQIAVFPEFKKVWREMEKNWRRFHKFSQA
jgi:predicted nucleotidyltransferase component of viral defense system